MTAEGLFPIKTINIVLTQDDIDDAAHELAEHIQGRDLSCMIWTPEDIATEMKIFSLKPEEGSEFSHHLFLPALSFVDEGLVILDTLDMSTLDTLLDKFVSDPPSCWVYEREGVRLVYNGKRFSLTTLNFLKTLGIQGDPIVVPIDDIAEVTLEVIQG